MSPLKCYKGTTTTYGVLTAFIRSDLSTRFKQLFKHSVVRLTPTRCSCQHPLLPRQPAGLVRTNGYILPVIVTEGMLLEQAIAEAMWVKDDTMSAPKTCPACGEEGNAGYFTRFTYLPEVFLILPYFMSKRYKDGYVRYTYDEKFAYPERLDMSGLADDPQKPGDKADTVYKLQSIITCTHQNMDAFTEYKAALRTSDNDWIQYGYGGDRGSTTEFTNFDNIIDPRRRQRLEEAPQMLMYVRDRHAKGFGNIPDEVRRSRSAPDPNTAILDKYGLGSSHLGRFIEAQGQPGEEGHSDMFNSARSELENGVKTGHWMWFMFPQVFGTTSSRLGDFYAIKSLGEAIAYWKDPDLKLNYLDLMNIVMESPEQDLEKMFGRMDALKFGASLFLFALVCNDEERSVFERVPQKFNETFYLAEIMKHTVRKVYDWLHDAGEDSAIAWMQQYVKAIPDHRSGEDDGKPKTEVPERGGLSVLVTSPKALAYNITSKGEEETEPPPFNKKDHEPDPLSIAGKNLLSELMKLSETEPPPLGDDDPERNANMNMRATRIGKLLLGYAHPGTPAETPDYIEKARRMGRNVIMLTRVTPPDTAPKETPKADVELPQADGAVDDASHSANGEVAFDSNIEPDDFYIPDDGHESHDFDLGGSSDEPAEDSHPDEENLHEAIAIPTDPKDPRIEASQAWTLDDLKAEFQKEQLDQRGLRNDQGKHRMKFLKHFELERDYSIYHESRLRQAVREKRIFIAKGVDRADKAELVDLLTEYDTRRLGEMEYVGEDTEQTDPAEFEAEEYQSSGEPETDRSSAGEETPRPNKRPRDEYEEEDDDFIEDEERGGDYGDQDYNDEDELLDPVPRALSKGYLLKRARH